MEKTNEPIQEGLQKRDPELYQEERADSDLQSNRQFQENKEQAQSSLQRNFLQRIKANEQTSSKIVLNENTDADVKQVKKSTENSLVSTQDLMRKIRLEAIAVHQSCDELGDNKILETKKNIPIQLITENPEEILYATAQDSMPTTKYYSNDAAQQPEKGQSETNEALQQRINISILNSKKRGLQQPSEVLESDVKVKDHNLVIYQKSAKPVEISEIPAEARSIQYSTKDQEVMQKTLSKGLDNFFKNYAMMQQGSRIPANLPRESISIPQFDLNYAKQQEWEKVASIENLKALQPIADLSRKLSRIGSKTDLDQSCKESGRNKNVREEDIIMQQGSATEYKLPKTQVETSTTLNDPQEQKLMQRKQALRKLIGDYMEKNKVNQQVTETCNEQNTLGVFNSEETKPLTSTDIVAYEKTESNLLEHKDFIKCDLESRDGVLPRSQEPEKDATKCQKTEGSKRLDNSVIVPAGIYDSKSVFHESSKDYVTFHKTQSIQIPSYPQKTKDYVTFRRLEPIGSASSSETKDYVTLAPRKPYNATIPSKISKYAFSDSETKGYVTREIIKPKIDPQPPTHIFWPVSRFKDDPYNLGSSTQTQVPESGELKPSPVFSGTPELKEAKKAPSSHQSRKCPRIAQLLQRQRPCPIPEDDEFQLVPSEEMCPETTIETDAQAAQRNKRIPIPTLSGIHDLVHSFYERYIPAERQATFEKLIQVCLAFFLGFLVGSSLATVLFFAIPSDIRKKDTGGSNFKFALNNPQLGMNTSAVTDLKRYSKRESLGGIVSRSVSHLVDSDVNFSTNVADFDVNINNSSFELNTEIYPVVSYLKNNMNALDNSESNLSTLVTNLDFKLINLDLGLTVPVIDLTTVTESTINVINLVTDININVTIPVTDLSINFTTCATIN